jgi:hypothetical protein
MIDDPACVEVGDLGLCPRVVGGPILREATRSDEDWPLAAGLTNDIYKAHHGSIMICKRPPASVGCWANEDVVQVHDDTSLCGTRRLSFRVLSQDGGPSPASMHNWQDLPIPALRNAGSSYTTNQRSTPGRRLSINVDSQSTLRGQVRQRRSIDLRPQTSCSPRPTNSYAAVRARISRARRD